MNAVKRDSCFKSIPVWMSPGGCRHREYKAIGCAVRDRSGSQCLGSCYVTDSV